VKRAKQTVIVKKSRAVDTLEKAKRLAREYADRLYTHRETSQSFRFRQRPPEDFFPGTFKTERVSASVAVVWGQLKQTKGGTLV